jgi:hypothetical protein
MLRDKIIFVQNHHTERPPDGLVIYPPIFHQVELYLLDPDMENIIYPLLAAVSAKTIPE